MKFFLELQNVILHVGQQQLLCDADIDDFTPKGGQAAVSLSRDLYKSAHAVGVVIVCRKGERGRGKLG